MLGGAVVNSFLPFQKKFGLTLVSEKMEDWQGALNESGDTGEGPVDSVALTVCQPHRKQLLRSAASK